MISVACAACKKKFNAKDDMAGRAGLCPLCKAPITVPTLGEAAKPPAADDTDMQADALSIAETAPRLASAAVVKTGGTGLKAAPAQPSPGSGGHAAIPGPAKTGGTALKTAPAAAQPAPAKTGGTALKTGPAAAPSAPARTGDTALKTGPAQPAAKPEGDRPAAAKPAPAGPGPLKISFLRPPQMPGELGRLSNYRILKLLGRGGMGLVFLAEDSMLKRSVALKVMLPTVAKLEHNRQRFFREAQAVAAIDHQHIIAIHQVGEDNGVPFLAMPFLKGEPLDARLRKTTKLALSEALRIGREIAEGLQAAHDRQLIHRDIKPANVWLEDPKGKVKILDFGLAHAVTGNDNLTQSGALIGTPAYMAPEQGKGQKIDYRADLFSLGCVLYRMVTGEMAFKGSDTISILYALASETPIAPHVINPAINAEVSELVMALLEKTPEKRPASAQEVAEWLAELEKTAGDVVVAMSPTPDQPTHLGGMAAGATMIKNLDDDDDIEVLDDEEAASTKKKKGKKKKGLSNKTLGLAIGGGVAAAALLGAVITFALSGGKTPEPAPTTPGSVALATNNVKPVVPVNPPVNPITPVTPVTPVNPPVNPPLPPIVGSSMEPSLNPGKLMLASQPLSVGMSSSEPVDATFVSADLQPGELLRYSTNFHVNDCFFQASDDGKRIAFSLRGTVLVWDAVQKRCLFYYCSLGDPQSQSFAISPDGKSLAFRNRSTRTIAVWDLETNRKRFDLPLTGTCKLLRFSSDGSKLVESGGMMRDNMAHDTELTIWDMNKGTLHAKTPEVGRQTVQQLRVDRDTVAALTEYNGRSLVRFELKTGKEISRHPLQLVGLGNWQFAEGAKQLGFFYATPGDNSLEFALQDSGDGNRYLMMDLGMQPRRNFQSALSPDGRMLLVANRNLLNVYDLTQRKKVKTLPGHLSDIRRIAWAGKNAVTMCNLSLRHWDLSDVYPKEDPKLTPGSGADLQARLNSAFVPQNPFADQPLYPGEWLYSTEYLNDLHWSNDASRLFISGSGGVYVFEVASKKLLRTFRGTGSGASFSPDGKFFTLASGSSEGRIVDADTLIERTWTSSSSVRIAVTADSKHVITFSPRSAFGKGSSGYALSIWDAQSLNLVAKADETVPSYPDIVAGERTLLMSSSVSSRSFDLFTGRSLRSSSGGSSGMSRTRPILSRDGKSYVLWQGGAAVIYSLETLQEIKYVRAQFSPPVSQSNLFPAFHATEDFRLLATSYGERIVIFDGNTGKVLKQLEGHTQPVRRVAFSRDGRILASFAADNSIRLWKLDDYPEAVSPIAVASLPKPTVPDPTPMKPTPPTPTAKEGVPTWEKLPAKAFHGIVITADSKTAYTVGSGAEHWDIEKGFRIKTLLSSFSQVGTAIALSADGKYLAYDGGQPLHLFNTKTQTSIGRSISMSGGGGDMSYAFSSDGQRLLMGNNGQLRDTDNIANNPRFYFRMETKAGPSPNALSVLFAQNDTIGLFGCDDGIIRSLKLPVSVKPGDRPVAQAFASHTPGTSVYQIAMANKLLLSVGQDQGFYLWDTTKAPIKLVKKFTDHKAPVRCVAVSPNGKYAVTGGNDKKLNLYSLSPPKLITTFTGHEDFVRSVDWAPNGLFIVSGSEDATLRCWKVPNEVQATK